MPLWWQDTRRAGARHKREHEHKTQLSDFLRESFRRFQAAFCRAHARGSNSTVPNGAAVANRDRKPTACQAATKWLPRLLLSGPKQTLPNRRVLGGIIFTICAMRISLFMFISRQIKRRETTRAEQRTVAHKETHSSTTLSLPFLQTQTSLTSAPIFVSLLVNHIQLQFYRQTHKSKLSNETI